MNKIELIFCVAIDAEITKAAAARAVGAVIYHISQATRDDTEGARIAGLGTFTAKRRDAHKGHNPRTGETIQIAARTVPKFAAAKSFHEWLNGDGGEQS